MTSLTLVRRIAARPSIIFDALTTPEGIACWWGPDEGPVLQAETDIRVGGHSRVRFRMLDGTEHESTGRYLEILKPARLVMSWRWTHAGEPEEAGDESRVEIDLRPIDTGCELTFTHSGLRTEASRNSHEQGWNGALDKLMRHFGAAIPTITTFGWVPEFARGFVRDLRPRWAFEEVGQSYHVNLIASSKTPEHRCLQPFGQVPTYRDNEVAIFESGAIVLRIAERAGRLIPTDTAARMHALQWVAAALNSVEPYVMALTTNDIFESDREWCKARHDKVAGDLKARLADLEAALGDKTWLDGTEFTVGDLMMISVLGGLRGTDMLAELPRLAAYVGRGESRPGHRKAMADHLATFAVTAPAGTSQKPQYISGELS